MPRASLKRLLRYTGSGAAALAAALSYGPAASGQGDTPGDFDFYVLSLSWSPSYCAAEGAEANRQQCGSDRPYAFVVHGLWPQYEQGYPEFCRSGQPDRVPGRLVEQYLDLLPSAGLIGHQWRKHGSCSGLAQADYFALLREARERITIPTEFSRPGAALQIDPDAVENGFLGANPGLDPAGITVTCDGRLIREVRICMTRDLQFRRCEEIDENSCRRESALMPPVR